MSALPIGTRCSPSGTSPALVVEDLVLDEDDRVVGADGGLEHALGVGRGAPAA